MSSVQSCSFQVLVTMDKRRNSLSSIIIRSFSTKWACNNRGCALYTGLQFSAIETKADCSQSVIKASSVHPVGCIHASRTCTPPARKSDTCQWVQELPVAATTDTVISLACWATPASLLVPLPTCLFSSSLQTGRMSRCALCSLSDPGILDNVAFTGQQCLLWRAAIFLKTLQLLCRQKTGGKVGCVL